MAKTSINISEAVNLYKVRFILKQALKTECISRPTKQTQMHQSLVQTYHLYQSNASNVYVGDVVAKLPW